MAKRIKLTRAEWASMPKIRFENVAMDFGVTVGFIKRVPTGLKVLDITSSGPDGVSGYVKLAKDRGDSYMFREGGSFNAYFIYKPIRNKIFY